MFRNMGLHVIKNPAGTYSYVGSIPLDLATFVEPTTSDIMAGRTFKVDGKIMTPKFPLFNTEQEAIAFAESKGHECKTPVRQ